MVIHSVYFWLKPGTTRSRRTRFLSAVRKLAAIRAVGKIYVGPPADLGKHDVTEGSFEVALTIVFEDGAAHDAYQADPIHAAFVKANKPLWAKVRVFDSQARPGS